MKKFSLILGLILLTILSFSQSPGKFNYQAVVRDISGQVISDQAVGIQISLLQTTVGGTPVYIETFTPTTNEFGLVNLEIGNGNVESGIFADIDWSAGPYFLKTELDKAGGADYVEIGTTQLLSVPYALHATTVDGLDQISDAVDLKQDKIARYSATVAGLVVTMGPNTGQPFTFNIVNRPDFAPATSDEIDVTLNGFIGPNPSSIEEPLVFYHEVIKFGDDFQIKVYVIDYDKLAWAVKFIKISCKAIYIK